MVGRWDTLNGAPLAEEFLSGLVDVCIWTGGFIEEHSKCFNAVQCVILDVDWRGGQGDQGICQIWKLVPCDPGRFLTMSHAC